MDPSSWLSDTYSRYTSGLTTHGLIPIIQGYKFEKIFWGTNLICALVLTYMISQSFISSYLSQEIVSNYKMTPTDTLRYPTLTICDSNEILKWRRTNTWFNCTNTTAYNNNMKYYLFVIVITYITVDIEKRLI